jgi:hypothetical protein
MIVIKRLVTILEKGLTFLGQPFPAEETGSAGRDQGPAHPVSHLQRNSRLIVQVTAQGTDPPHHFVAKDGGRFNRSFTPDGMQVTPTERATRNLHHGLPFPRARILKRSQAQWLARTLKNDR